VKVEGEAARKVVRLLELLEDNDDVQNVWANADISERELEQMGA
jgi:transcriptional/translational regulatory protein YebC/TACO1